MRNCKACGIAYEMYGIGTSTTYCSEHCRSVVRKLAQRVNRDKARARGKLPMKNKAFLLSRACTKYKSYASRKNCDFDLTVESLGEFFQIGCIYCGDSISGIGICRKDTSGGYVVGNIVSCCENCSRMKNVESHARFVERCIKVANIHKRVIEVGYLIS